MLADVGIRQTSSSKLSLTAFPLAAWIFPLIEYLRQQISPFTIITLVKKIKLKSNKEIIYKLLTHYTEHTTATIKLPCSFAII